MRMETSSPASEAQTRGTNRPHTTPQHSHQTALSGQCTSSSTIQPTTSTATSTHTRYLARTNTSPLFPSTTNTQDRQRARHLSREKLWACPREKYGTVQELICLVNRQFHDRCPQEASRSAQ